MQDKTINLYQVCVVNCSVIILWKNRYFAICLSIFAIISDSVLFRLFFLFVPWEVILLFLREIDLFLHCRFGTV